MTVKEWREALADLPDDAEVYYHDGETGLWISASPEFVDETHELFQKARKFDGCTVPKNEPFVNIDLDLYPGRKNTSGISLKENQLKP